MHLLIFLLAKYGIFPIGLIAFIYWLNVNRKEKLRLAVFGAIVAAISVLLLVVGSKLYYDPRPFVTHAVTPIYPHGADNGFPSDHTILVAFIAVTIFSSSKRLGGILFGMTLLVGISRVAGNIHSPIDIVGSIIFAILGGVTAYVLTPKIIAKLNK